MSITQSRFFLSDFVSIQRNSFMQFLEKGLIEEISKRNPITNTSNSLEVFFYGEYYQLSAPKYSPKEAILKGKSYSSRLFVPVQLTDRVNRVIKIKWVYLCDLPIMTKRGHFIINGAARVIVNQIIRSPGIYYQTKIYENFNSKWDQTPESTFERQFADLICQRGTWLRLEVDKDKKIWGQTKKGPKIPIMWLLLAMGLTEKIIFKSMLEPARLLYNMVDLSLTEKVIENTKEADAAVEPLIYWDLEKLHGPNSVEYILQSLELLQKTSKSSASRPNSTRKSTKKLDASLTTAMADESFGESLDFEGWKDVKSSKESNEKAATSQKQLPQYIKTPPEAWANIYTLFAKHSKRAELNKKSKTDKANQENIGVPGPGPKGLKNAETSPQSQSNLGAKAPRETKPVQSFGPKGLMSKGSLGGVLKNAEKKNLPLSELGRQFIFNKFMNPRTYDLSKHGRLSFNKKLNLSISPTHTTLTPQDLLAATNHLFKVEYGLKTVDDIDNLKNRRVRTSGELIQLQFGTGLLRLEKTISEKLNNSVPVPGSTGQKNAGIPSVNKNVDFGSSVRNETNYAFVKNPKKTAPGSLTKAARVTINELIPNTKAVNSALREFFGTSPLSQFMDQINPLAEITHKRRLSSMGPGGVTRDSATLEIRGIHPSHYGRICPVETPEGKNTGLVNSLTTYARVNKNGYIETPFYKVFKGQVQTKTGMSFFSADKEENIRLGAADLSTSNIGFLDKADIPVRIKEDFTKIPRDLVEYAGVAPSQMVSIATSLIPFLEHDDANRALMGSNMQRQAVPIIKPERPIVGTGLEARVVCDSGHALDAKTSGVVTYVSSDKIIVYALRP